MTQKIVEYLSTPIKKKFPEMDFWWLIYVAFAIGVTITWFTNINLFLTFIPNEVIGRLLTGLLVGGGSSLIHDVFDNLKVKSNLPRGKPRGF